MFTLEEVECLGACVNAPMIQVNNEWFYEDLTPELMKVLLYKLANGETVTPGPQTARKNSEGPMGRSTLKSKQNTFYERDFKEAKRKWETEIKKKAASKK